MKYKTKKLIEMYEPIASRLIADAEKATNIEHQPAFVDKSRKEKFLFLRYAVIYHLHKNFYLSANAISKLLGYDHTTIDNALSQIKYLSIAKHSFRNIMRTVYDCVLKMKNDDEIIRVMRQITKYKQTGAIESGHVYDSTDDSVKLKNSSGYQFVSYDGSVDRDTLLDALNEFALDVDVNTIVWISLLSGVIGLIIVSLISH